MFSEQELISRSLAAVSATKWRVGQSASHWFRRYSRGRGICDFAVLVGLPEKEVWHCRQVYDRFASCRDEFPSLRWGHFFAALEWDDPEHYMKWANEMEATVAEMRAWRRAQRGDDLTQEEKGLFE